VKIEPLTQPLIDDAVRLWEETGLTRPWNDPRADARRALAGPASTILAATEGDALIGTAMVGHDGHRGWLYYLAVAQDRRLRGVGRALVGACERWLLDRGLPKLNLMIRTDNAEVASFYAAIGFGPSDVLVLSRRLYMANVVQDNPKASRYELLVDGELVGFLVYRVRGDRIDLVHTEIDPSRQGLGLGAELVRGTLDGLRSRGLPVAPICPFVSAFIAGHPASYLELVAEPWRERITAA
jgi:GNAT superfamily N-acetyltransferase